MSGASLPREPVQPENPERRVTLRGAGFISTLRTASDIQTKRDPSSQLRTAQQRMRSLLLKSLRQIRAGMDPPSSLQMTGDRRLPVCRSAGIPQANEIS